MACLLCIYIFSKDYFVSAEEESKPDPTYIYNDTEWATKDEMEFKTGKIVYYSQNSMVCNR